MWISDGGGASRSRQPRRPHLDVTPLFDHLPETGPFIHSGVPSVPSLINARTNDAQNNTSVMEKAEIAPGRTAELIPLFSGKW